jgi:hypothetical protein
VFEIERSEGLLQVWDVIIASPPSQFLLMVLALLLVQRKQILATAEKDISCALWNCLYEPNIDKVML